MLTSHCVTYLQSQHGEIMIIDITGHKFGRLTVIERAVNKGTKIMWHCICECGEKTTCRGEHLRNGLISSCGCLAIEMQTKHGMARTPIYWVWQNMKDRCNNPNNPQFSDYGGRGVKVCDRWMAKFEHFHADMGDCPQGMTLDRIDNNRGYCKDNCQWSTRRNQVLNRRNTKLYTVGIKTMCVKHWCAEVCIPYATARNRMKKGKSFFEALKFL